MEPLRISAAAGTGPVVHPDLYGHFAEHLGRGIYEGLWVGEESAIPNTRGLRNDVVEALRELRIPVLRWPGGCFADEYHWRDGIGPRGERPSILNTHWGRVVENNHFGTHEFFDLCERLGAAPYVCGNVGSGTVREMMEWVEYISSDATSPMADLRRRNGREAPWRLPYFGVGNESWGCGGNMRPEYYADEYRRYNCFVKNYSGNEVYRIACGANTDDVRWTEVLMERAGPHMDGLSLHYYTLTKGWPPSGSATGFDDAEYASTLAAALRMREIVAMHAAVMDRFDPDRRVGMIVDEWGTWFAPEPDSTPGFLYQQNAMRDALVAAVTFHIFHAAAARVRMANIAQMVNVLQAMVLTDGPRMLRTPTYWVFRMFREHQGGTVLPLDFASPEVEVGGHVLPALSASATRGRDGSVRLSLANLDPSRPLAVGLPPFGEVREALVLAGDSPRAHNTFDDPDRVAPTPLAVVGDAGGFRAEIPPASVASIGFA